MTRKAKKSKGVDEVHVLVVEKKQDKESDYERCGTAKLHTKGIHYVYSKDYAHKSSGEEEWDWYHLSEAYCDSLAIY